MKNRCPNRFQFIHLTIIQSAFLITTILLFAHSSFAQVKPEPAPAEAPTITTNSNEVSVGIVVRGKKNKPVLDLKPEDITVADNGTVVKVSSLRLVDANSDVDRLITLVFDQLEPSAANNARNIAGKLLKTIPEKNFSLAVMGVDGRLKLYQAFTSDRNMLTKAITAATERSVKESTESEKRLMAEAESGADASGTALSLHAREISKVTLAGLQESQRIVQDQHTQPALAGLIALARTQRQIEGRKIVVYFSQSLHADINTRDVLLSIIGSANRAGLSIYSVDTNAVNAEAGQGLVASIALGNMASAQALAPANPLFDATTRTPIANPAPAGLSAQASDRADRAMNEGLSGHTEPLAFLAESTGGAYMTANDNLRKPLERLLEDLTTYYELSYVPPIQEYDGRFRTISIQPVHEKLKIQSRAGYFALPPGNNGGSIRPFEAPLLAALTQLELPTDLNFHSSVLRLGELPDGNANELVVEVPLSEIDMKEDVNTRLFSLHVAIVSQIKSKTGTVIEHFSEDIPRHGATETMSDARSQVITMQRHFIAPPGDYVLESAVMDRNTGKLSAQRSEFIITPKPTGGYLSDLALVRRTDPFTWEADPLEPMRYQNGKIVPNLSGAISPDAKDVSFFLMVHPDPQTLEPARLEMEVSKNGQSLARMPLPLRATSGQGVVPYLASIQSKSLAPGRYDVSTRLIQNGSTTERTISLQVGGPEIASTATASGVVPPGSNVEQADSSVQTAALKPLNSHPIVISSLPTTALSVPSAEKLATLISNTRERAVGYAKSLPNFVCVEVTDRSVDTSGQGKWKRQDTISELLRFRDQRETRTTITVNGHESAATRDDMAMKGTTNRGEFGAMLDTIFRESAKAEFEWKESVLLDSVPVEVLTYHVAKENSNFAISVGNDRLTPGFHGLVYVDSVSNGIRRITMEADPMAATVSVKKATFTVDYDYIAIGSHDYLLPIRASMNMRQGRKSIANDMVFRNYRRYAANSKILTSEPEKR